MEDVSTVREFSLSPDINVKSRELMEHAPKMLDFCDKQCFT